MFLEYDEPAFDDFDTDDDLAICDWCGADVPPVECYRTSEGSLCPDCYSALLNQDDMDWA